MAKKSKEKEVLLLCTVNYDGVHYPPGKVMPFPKDIADELIDNDAAEMVLAVATKDKVSETEDE